MFYRKGQVTVEAAVLLTIVIGGLALMALFMRASVMGGWFNSAQQLGDPYNPKKTTGTVTHSLTSETITHVNTINDSGSTSSPDDDSAYTLRIDTGKSYEGKQGTLTVEP